MPALKIVLRRCVTALAAAAIIGFSWYALQVFVPGNERYQLRFTEMDVSTPPPYVPQSWLQDVQALGRLPEVLDTRAKDLPSQLRQAFAASPWVDEVELVAIRSHRRIESRLHFRAPVAVVPVESDAYLVDAKGIALPRGPQTTALEALLLPIRGAASAPHQGFGRSWGNAAVETAAGVAAAIRSERETWQIVAIELGADPLRSDVRLRTRKGTVVIWQTIGGDSNRETSSAEKVRHLRDYSARFGSLDQPSGPYELDLRFPEGILRRPLAP